VRSRQHRDGVADCAHAEDIVQAGRGWEPPLDANKLDLSRQTCLCQGTTLVVS
jgi:hypothetical protein